MDGQSPAKRPKQKRNRIITACYDCRERKAGCDRRKPICTRCRNCRTCVYLDPPNNALVNGVSRKVSSLPPDIKKKVTRLYSQCLGDGRDTDQEEEDDDLEVNPLILDSASYEDDAAVDEQLDLGFRVGKLQLADRVGGQHRPGVVYELRALLQITARQPEWLEEQRKWPVSPEIFTQGISSPGESFMKPSKSYLAPRVSLISLKLPFVLDDYLPPRPLCDQILAHYWLAVHPIARVVHRPSFEKRWHIFMDDLEHQRRPTRSLVAIVFAVLFAAMVAMSPEQIPSQNNKTQNYWLHRLHTGTELALEQAQMVHTTKVETMQAFTAYLAEFLEGSIQALCLGNRPIGALQKKNQLRQMVLSRAEISRVHSALVAAAIRIAECNGLHCDGSERGYSAIETHVRRLIWYNLCFLDMRVSEALGPRPIIRSEEFTTKLPLNIDDADLGRPDLGSLAEKGFRESSCTIIRFRCQEFIRWIWTARKQLELKEITVTSVLNKIEAFRLEWSLKFTPQTADPNPLHQYTLEMLDLMSLRTFAMILSPYWMHPTFQMPAIVILLQQADPDRLIEILFERGMQTMERVIDMETSKKYSLWHWYSGALHQHHYAFLMSTILLSRPRHKDSARCWRGLEYVFEPPQLPPIARARWIITHSCLRLDAYLTKRRLRAPAEIQERLNDALRLSEQSNDAPVLRQSDPPPPLPLIERRSSQNYPDGPPRPEPRDKQMLHVDWNILSKYYPPGTYSGEMDLRYDIWTQNMQLNASSSEYMPLYYPRTPLYAMPYETEQSQQMLWHAPPGASTQYVENTWTESTEGSSQYPWAESYPAGAAHLAPPMAGPEMPPNRYRRSTSNVLPDGRDL